MGRFEAVWLLAARSLRRVSLAFGLAIGVVGCGAPAWKRPVYDQCLAEPPAFRDGRVRDGVVNSTGFSEGVYGPVAVRVTISRTACLDTVDIVGPNVQFHGGPFLPVSDAAFAASDAAGRVAFAYQTEAGEAWVWVDGTRYGPYASIAIGPRFSAEGRHVAWATMDGDEQVLFVDGREVRRGRRFGGSFFWVLDDGRVAAPLLHEDFKFQVVVGNDYDSGVLDEACGSFSFEPGPRGHWGFAAKKDGRWRTIVDGRELPGDGVPSGCHIAFSSDGAHFGYLSMPVAATRHVPTSVVLDGRAFPVDEGAHTFEFVGDLPLVRSSRQLAPNTHDWETLVEIVGAPTPEGPSARDAFEPRADYQGRREWARVKIGDSLGPMFDRVEGFAREPDGQIRYVGLRGETRLDVVDNRIVPAAPPRPPLRTPAIAE